jgi:hypothetical protein
MGVLVSNDKSAKELSVMRMALVICSRLLLLATLFASSWASAQEGHPYEGTWRGTINMGATNAPVVMIIDYDGENLNGLINPGKNSYKFAAVEHDAPNCKLTVNAETRDSIPISFTAVMKDIGSVKRYMEGTWTQDGEEYPFRITRE